ncbi:hypothetical protein CERZMDRAFT_45832, partial [Cercospora zeae-maydis SCOH1-5]
VKCYFFKKKVKFLRFIICPKGIIIDPRRVNAIIAFANFYRRFIYRYSRIVATLIVLLKRAKAGKKLGRIS